MTSFKRPVSALSISKQRQYFDSNLNAFLRHSKDLTKGKLELPNNNFIRLATKTVESKGSPLHYSKSTIDNKEELMVSIRKLELQQESNNDCIIKRLNELHKRLSLLEQSRVRNVNIDERDTSVLLDEISKINYNYNNEIPNIQATISYLKENVVEKIAKLEVVNTQLRSHMNSKITALEHSLEFLHNTNNTKHKELTQHINALMESNYQQITDTLHNHIRNSIFTQLVERRVLEYAKLKEEEDCRKLLFIERRLLELDGEQKELNKKLEMFKIDVRINAKKKEVLNVKLKELEETIAKNSDYKGILKECVDIFTKKVEELEDKLFKKFNDTMINSSGVIPRVTEHKVITSEIDSFDESETMRKFNDLIEDNKVEEYNGNKERLKANEININKVDPADILIEELLEDNIPVTFYNKDQVNGKEDSDGLDDLVPKNRSTNT